MPTQSVLASIYIGQIPPSFNGGNVRWLSQSLRHVRFPDGSQDRQPIIGSYLGQTQAQEPSPYFNTILNRWEMLVHIGTQQYWSYALDSSPRGAWSTPVAVLGAGLGGEAASAIQASVYMEGGIVYCVYCKSQGVTQHFVATSPLSSNPNVVPVFAATGAPISSSVTINNARMFNNWIIKNPNGGYLMTAEGNGAPAILLSTQAANPAGWAASPFTPLVVAMGGDTLSLPFLGVNSGNAILARTRSEMQRPQLFYENGMWILFGSISGVSLNDVKLFRWTSLDMPYPVNWTLDSVAGRLIYPRHFLEQDQLVDVRLTQGPIDGKWYAFWTGCDNSSNLPNSGFNILAVPLQETMMAFDGADWVQTVANTQTGADTGWILQDQVTQSYIASHLDDLNCDAGANAGVVVTAPTATNTVRFRLNNTANNNGVAEVGLAVQGSDKISSGNPITSLTAVSTLVTVGTFAPHLLATGDLVTISGASPVAYNINAAACTVTGPSSFTYVAGSAPAAETALGVYERGVRPGETRAWICNKIGMFSRLTG